MNIHVKFLEKYRLSFLLSKYFRTKFLDHMTALCIIIKLFLQIRCTMSHAYQQWKSINCCLKNTISGSCKTQDMFSYLPSSRNFSAL